MRNFDIYLESGDIIKLTEHDLSNSGGEGEIFIKGGYAYKIFFDINKSIEKDKIKELSMLDRHNIIRPIQSIYNKNKEPIGYQMKALFPDKCYPLTRFFTNDFRQQNQITDAQVSNIIKEIYETFEFIHKLGCLVVDGNEMNFLVSEDFKDIYFIDVDSYKTPNFKPTAYNPNTLDPLIKKENFNTGSDWYIFGILFCQIVLGIHPFKGVYTGTSMSFGKKDIEKRMKMGISILNPKIKLNKAVREISIISIKMREWLDSTFKNEKRSKPPLVSKEIISNRSEIDYFNLPNGFKVYESETFTSCIDGLNIIDGSYIYRKDGLYFSKEDVKLSKTENLIFKINEKTAFAKLTDNHLEVYIPESNIRQKIMDNVEKIYSFNNKLFIYKNNKISILDLMEANKKIITGINNTWDLFIHKNINNFILFYQSEKLKSYYLYENDKNAIIDIDKMIEKNEKLINIKGYKEYVVIKTLKNNEYICKIFKIDFFSKITTLIHTSISFDTSINFILNKELLIGEIQDNDLIIGYCKNNDFKSKIINNFTLNKELFSYKDKVSFFDKNKLYQISLI